MLRQVKQEKFQQNFNKGIKKALEILEYVTKTEKSALLFLTVDKTSLAIRVYSNSPFAGSNDLHSQLEYVILFIDKNGKCQIVRWSTHKARRVTRSDLGRNVMTFAYKFDLV